MITLIVFASMRPGEALALRWKDILCDRVVVDERVYDDEFLAPAPDEAVAVADVSTAALLWAQREGLDADARGILSELRKRFGKRYSVRKVGGKSVRVFTGVRLLVDALPTRSGGVTVSTA